MTLGQMSPKKPEPTAEEVAALELVRLAREAGLSLTGPDGLLKQFTKTVLETALNEEMTEHLGHAQNWAPAERATCNVRNGIRPKTVLTEAPTRGVFWVTAAGRAGVRSWAKGRRCC